MLGDLSKRTIAIGILAVVIILLASFGLSECQKRRSAADQARVERSQAEAASNSAADAINAVAASDAASGASEDLTRENERDIRAANGANDAVNPAVRDAGLAALCKRRAYANDPRCRHP